MMIWRRGRVLAIKKTWSESLELEVELCAADTDPSKSTDNGKRVKALAYRQLVGTPRVGDILALSAAAVKRGLGTGGYLFVVANLSALPPDPDPQPGHLVKARYTPSQFMVQGVDEQESPFHAALANADKIDGMPVICADLHSALPAIVLGLRAANPNLRIAYVMTDGAALPAWFSQVAAQLHADGAILGTISCGQAFGGELEAVNIYTALLAAKHVWNADAAVVTQGPGNLGTGTKWGFSGTQIGEALNAAGILGGKPVAALRLSNADQRARHYGLSHHSERILTDIVTAKCSVPLPALQQLRQLELSSENTNESLIPDGFSKMLASQIETLAQLSQSAQMQNLDFPEVDFWDLLPVLEHSPYPLRTMGRQYHEDAAAFIAAATAGKYVGETMQ